MKCTTLCYIEQNNQYLMLHRIKKKNDLNEGKWIGVGGHIEPGETPEECVRREVLEETGLTLNTVSFRGTIEFISERWPDETMYLYTSDDFSGTMTECNEGVLEWIPKNRLFDLPLWEGDRVFLNYLIAGEPFFHLRLCYDDKDALTSCDLLPNIVLASASPRRKELLAQIGISPMILPANLEEVPEGNTPAEIVCSLSRQKAQASAALINGNAAVIGADTIVTIDGKILGKPASHEEAADMIRSLAGRTHEVYTGVTIIFTENQPEPEGHSTQNAAITSGEPAAVKSSVRSDDADMIRSSSKWRMISFAEKTEVRVAPMSDEEILLYAASKEPMDKAGAYGIQGAFAAFIEGICGDYNNVVGLPVRGVYRALQSFLTKD